MIFKWGSDFFLNRTYLAVIGGYRCIFPFGELGHLMAIGLITVSDAILTGRQSGQKLQCLYGNPMANNFFQNRILRNW